MTILLAGAKTLRKPRTSREAECVLTVWSLLSEQPEQIVFVAAQHVAQKIKLIGLGCGTRLGLGAGYRCLDLGEHCAGEVSCCGRCERAAGRGQSEPPPG